MLSRKQINALSPKALVAYNKSRRDWHANLGPFRTSAYSSLREDLASIIDNNEQDGHNIKGSVVVDSPPAVGKTTTVLQYAKKFHRDEIAAYGERTDEGNERWPVCWVSLSGNPTLLEVNRSMLTFFAHPGARGSADEFALRALDCMLLCKTQLLIIDDLHFLRFPSKNGLEVSNHFKFIEDKFPVTAIFIGVGLADTGVPSGDTLSDTATQNPSATGFLTEGKPANAIALAQTARRTTPLTMASFGYRTRADRKVWRELLLTIEQRLVLAGSGPGMLADELADYLFERSTGYIGSLMTLINRGCGRAIRGGAEELTKDLLEQVKIDAAANAARADTAAIIRRIRQRSASML
jgi:hypothetical protein